MTGIVLSKMGVGYIDVWDDDVVDRHNLPNQMYFNQTVGFEKVDALNALVESISMTKVGTHRDMFKSGFPLNETVIVTTDSMMSRKIVWAEFLKQKKCKLFIDARMGGQLGLVYTIQHKTTEDIKFYEDNWYPDSKAANQPCTSRAIIYNIAMIAALIARAYKGVLNKEPVPREQIFNMTRMDKHSYMVTL